MRWLIANPNKRLTDCAAALGYTLPWLSIITRSEAFQAELRSRQAIVFDDVALDIKDKLLGTAHLALEKVMEHIPNGSPEFALDAAKETLKSLGYSSQRAVQPGTTNITNIQQNNYNNVSQDELARARAIMTHREASPSTGEPHTDQPLLPEPSVNDST